MKFKSFYGASAVALFIGLLLFSVTGWNPSAAQAKPAQSDTIPKSREKKIRDLDEAIEQLDSSLLQLNSEWQRTDWQKIEKDIQISLKDINNVQIKKDIELALKEVNIAEIKADVERSMKELDTKQMKLDIDKALKEIDVEKIKLDVNASLATIDMEAIKRDLEQVKKTDFAKLEVELKNLKPELEKNVKGARESIEKTKTELQEYKAFIDDLDKNGLINKKDDYAVEHKDGTLTINGKAQAADVYKRHLPFLQKHKSFTIKKNEDFNIRIE